MSTPYQHEPMEHNPIEWTGNIQVHYPKRVTKTTSYSGPSQKEPIFQYGWFCGKCKAWHEETGECPYE